jgi:hypothetical protein
MLHIFEKLASVFVTELLLNISKLKVHVAYKNLLIHFICHRKHTLSFEKTIWLVVCGKIGTACCVIHTEFMSTLSGQNAVSFWVLEQVVYVATMPL